MGSASKSDSHFVDISAISRKGEAHWVGLMADHVVGIRGHVLAEMWLSIPQAVVLEATGDLVRAKSLEAGDPFLLIMKAVRLLPPILSIDAGASHAEMRTAVMARVAEPEVQTARGGYERTLQAVCDKLINGVTAKGRRAPYLPVETIDPAEFAQLELRDFDAVDPWTGKTVWYGVLISARELSASGEPVPSSGELHQLPSHPDASGQTHAADQPGSPTKLPPPLSDRDLRSWYEERVSGLRAGGEAASGEADWEAARQVFPGRVTRARIRQLRQQLAPADWQKQGRRTIKAK